MWRCHKVIVLCVDTRTMFCVLTQGHCFFVLKQSRCFVVDTGLSCCVLT